MLMVIPFPAIDPVLVQIGPVAIRWYAIGYIVSLTFAWWFMVRLLKVERLWAGAPFNGKRPITAEQIGDLFVWAAAGVILGGRLGYVLFYGLVYNPDYFLSNPLRIFAAWEGGMSFHGGLLGVVVAIVIFSLRNGIDMFRLGDLVAIASPVGIFVVRIANFINGELWGRPSDVPWAMVFPNADLQPRHPSQLYEAGLEGLLLFAILCLLVFRFDAFKRPAFVSGVFFFGYGLARILVEGFFRDSDQRLFGADSWFTMGMALSLPMWAGAAFFFWYAFVRQGAQPVQAQPQSK